VNTKEDDISQPVITLLYAGLLILLGLVGYLTTGRESVTALIPTFAGVVILILGLFAVNEGYRMPMLWAAAVLALLGFAGTVSGVPQVIKLVGGGEVARPAAAISKAIMACLSLLYILIWIRFYFTARS
jgi:hypothetical protein